MLMLFALGLLVGLVFALTGAGGSIIAVPALMFGMDWPITQASPVALLAVSVAAAFGTWLSLRAQIVRFRAATLMALCGIPMTPIGLFVAHRVPLTPLTLIFACLLFYIGVSNFRKALQQLSGVNIDEYGKGQAPCLVNTDTGRFKWTPKCARLMSAAGAGTGFVSGLLGVGGGFLIVPALKKVSDLDIKSIAATSMMVIGIVSLFAVLSAAVAGHLPGTVAAPFTAGAVAGMFGGRLIAERISGPRLQQAFAILCLLVAVALLIKTLY